MDKKLREILRKPYVEGKSMEEVIAQIKQVFLEESGIDEIIQDMTNLRANMQHDVIRLGLSGKAPGLMTGQEWLERFQKELDSKDEPHTRNNALKAARKASGVDNG